LYNYNEHLFFKWDTPILYDVALGLRHTKTNTIGLKKQKYIRKGEE
jgi:hypothetical protein